MFVFPLWVKGPFWSSLKSWAFPWIPIPLPIEKAETPLHAQNMQEQEQEQKINRDA
ncbi:hypothetical protein [Comamonas sp. JNW]|uniref:hypothetical protein n=1 Tax=Comamonas sp. JNW TaxID=2170731 RepID=UPI001403AFC6|nr:hypothetical protein [Comamonas sp. JNW]